MTDAGERGTGLTVTIREHAEQMDMGRIEMPVLDTDTGPYVAADVSLGMGGRGAGEIQIASTGRDPVTMRPTLALCGSPARYASDPLIGANEGIGLQARQRVGAAQPCNEQGAIAIAIRSILAR